MTSALNVKCVRLSSLQSLTRLWSRIRTTWRSWWRRSTSGSSTVAGRRSSGARCPSSSVSREIKYDTWTRTDQSDLYSGVTDSVWRQESFSVVLYQCYNIFYTFDKITTRQHLEISLHLRPFPCDIKPDQSKPPALTRLRWLTCTDSPALTRLYWLACTFIEKLQLMFASLSNFMNSSHGPDWTL